ncbi:hypothetical protein [Vibrio hibernica]|uniref:hypothetical protein n=1 Tax=Vibrio hibernica TaxID=2587465 RepID=UPI0039AF25D2
MTSKKELEINEIKIGPIYVGFFDLNHGNTGLHRMHHQYSTELKGNNGVVIDFLPVNIGITSLVSERLQVVRCRG